MTVFLSYAHQDKATATALARDLEELEGSVWLDKSLTGGQRWWDEILQQIRACRLFVLAVSPHSVTSGACLAESAYAMRLERPFLAVRVGKVDLLSAPADIRRLQLVDFVANDADSIRALARAVINAPQPDPLPEVLPDEPPMPESYRDRFSQLFARELPVADQISACARLKMDVESDQNADEARELLGVLRDRHDVVFKVHQDITRFLGERPGQGAVEQKPREQPLPVTGWYVDPTRRFELRYWSGTAWTSHVTRGGQRFEDPFTGT
jgi:hypothetical protein